MYLKQIVIKNIAIILELLMNLAFKEKKNPKLLILAEENKRGKI